MATLDDESAAEAVPGELVVDFRDDESRDQVAALGRQLGVTFRPASSLVDTDEIYTVDSGDTEGRSLEMISGRWSRNAWNRHAISW